jgi:hypothetical protein
MHIDITASIALAIIGHAWITRVNGPPQVVNVVAWVFGLVITVVALFGAFAR